MASYPPIHYYRRNRKAIQCLWLFVGFVLAMIGIYMFNLWDTLDRPIVRPVTRPSLLKTRKSKQQIEPREYGKKTDFQDHARQKELNRGGTRTVSPDALKQKPEINGAGRRTVSPEVFKQKPEKGSGVAPNRMEKDKKSTTHHNQHDKPSDKFVHIYDEDPSNVSATCVDYKMIDPVKGVTKLCVHSGNDDMFVSGSFLKGGIWEQNMVKSMGVVLSAHPDMVFIDVGSHMGMYTMYANKAGNQAIAIDPLTKNLRLLRKSVKLTKQEKHVTLLLNAVSDKHEQLYLEEGQANNIGSTHLVAANKTVNKDKLAADYKIQTIMLDDLLEVFELDNKEVMMKMDVEGYEWKALLGGRDFFRRVNVCYVMLEFASHKFSPSGLEIIQFMASYNLFPHHQFVDSNRLPLNDTHEYSIDTIFIKETAQCLKHA